MVVVALTPVLVKAALVIDPGGRLIVPVRLIFERVRLDIVTLERATGAVTVRLLLSVVIPETVRLHVELIVPALRFHPVVTVLIPVTSPCVLTVSTGIVLGLPYVPVITPEGTSALELIEALERLSVLNVAVPI